MPQLFYYRNEILLTYFKKKVNTFKDLLNTIVF